MNEVAKVSWRDDQGNPHVVDLAPALESSFWGT